MALAAVDKIRARSPRIDFDRFPLLAIWEVTQACDLACAHCRACAIPERDPLELSTAEGQRLLERIKDMGTPLVVLTGGDPAKRADLPELIEYGARLGLTMAVTPSGTPLMTGGLLGRLKEAGLARLAVSIDGPDAETHDAFRGVAGSFVETVRILAEARAIGLETQVNTSLSPLNIGSIDELADLVREVGAVLWSVFVVVPTGRADRALMVSAEELEGVLERLAEIAESHPFDIKTTAAPHFRRVLLERRTRRSAIGLLDDIDADGVVRGPRGINDGSGFLFVSHRGDVFPSGFLPTRAGNVRADDVVALYRESPLFRKLRDSEALSGKCGVCPFRHVCGGSRARAFALTGDLMASDPSCAYVPQAWARATSR